MNVALWVVQVLLALAYALAGLMKLTQPYERLQQRMGWVADFPRNNVRLIGLAETLAAIGLIIPAVTGILPWLTPLAATGLVILMAGAMFTHIRRHEMFVPPLVLLVLALFIVYGRFVAAPLPQ